MLGPSRSALLTVVAVFATASSGCHSGDTLTPEAAAAIDALMGGRWWIDSPVAPVYVTHWKDDDRVIWSGSFDKPFPLHAQLESDGGVRFTWPGPSPSGSCFVVRASTDPDARDLWTCASPQGPSAGYLRRGAVLVRPTTPAELAALPETLSGEKTSFVAADPTGRWTVIEVGDRLTLWKSDTDQRFDLGRGFNVGQTMDNRPDADLIDFSPDGRYVAYPRPTDDDGHFSLVLYDTATRSERIVEPDLIIHGDLHVSSAQRFSPDGRRLVFYGNEAGDAYGDLVAVDVASGARVILAHHTAARMLQTCLWFTRADHAVFCDFGDSIDQTAAPLKSYEFSTGARRDLGTASRVLTAPDGGYLAVVGSSGQIVLLEEADWTPRIVSDARPPVAQVTCVSSSPDGAWLAFVGSSGSLRLFDVRNRAVTEVADAPLCASSYGIGIDQFLAPLAEAGFFLPDGRTFVHLRRASDEHLSAVTRRDLVTGQESTTTLDGSGIDLMALSPAGDFVYSRLPDQAWLVKGGAPSLLPWTSPSNFFWFTEDDRYLISFRDDIGVLDLTSGTTVSHPARLQSLPPFRASASGVVLVSPENWPMMLYFPSGEAMTLAPSGRRVPDVSPGPSPTALYSAGRTLNLVRLEPRAIPRPVGQGSPLGASARQAFFRDLDGICAIAL